MSDKENKGFSYTYSSDEQDRIREIRERYCPTKDERADKMARLYKLDSSVTKKATAIAIVFGIVGALILGLGMSLFMTELGTALGSAELPVGIAIGLVGLILVSLAYPVSNMVTERDRARIAPEVLRLTDELLEK